MKFLRNLRFRSIARDLKLLFGSLISCFLIIEIGYRVLDPFPFFSKDEINTTRYGNLSEYNPILGWKGVSGGRAEFISKNNRVSLANNRYGFRDIEHDDLRHTKPKIVFLGDSFTWGYEVEFEEMFVTRLRALLPSYEIFNLAHKAYGTDQELLTFKLWPDQGPIKLVILMFSENDVNDNNSTFRYDKWKPKYQLVDNELVLTGIPVPKLKAWADSKNVIRKANSWKTKLEKTLFWSHFLRDMAFRCNYLHNNLFQSPKKYKILRADTKKSDLTLTSAILLELKKEVERRRAKLVVTFIPSKREIEQLDEFPPYQLEIASLCQKLGIEYFDLAQYFKKSWFRTYYRRDMHWNSRGHQVAAEALYDYLN